MRLSAPILVIGILLIGGGLFLRYWERDGGPPQPPGLTEEAKTYVKHLQLSEVDMKATKSYMNQMVVEIVGKIGNTGDRGLRQVDLNCVFYDAYGQLVLRERASIVRASQGGLEPGETKPFRLAFDTLPESWNQGMPQLVIAHIGFK
jgi:hypothetical protein